MTTFEHAMLGTTGALAAGLQCRSWQIVAMAGVAAVLPDWDGLSILFGAAAFDEFHRAVGHSVLVATGVAIVVALAEYRLRFMARFAALLGQRIDGFPVEVTDLQKGISVREGVTIWTLTAVLATWSHLAADLVFSSHGELSNWGLKLFWPCSQATYVFPAVRWGDVLPTIILVLGMFAMLRWRSCTQRLATLTLFALVGYIALRAFVLPY
jgi:inner membrane protein